MYIADGRKLFYQWDLDREIIVTDPDITELHFSNDGSHHSLVCAVHNGRASVPNILLQQGGNLHVFAAEDNHTETARIYKILPRPKPDDYVYTETEVLRWETLETRMEELAQQVDNVAQTVTTQAIDARIAGYLAANPPQETDPTVSDWARQPEPPKALPDGGAPHQMLVTDAEGVAKWENRLCYETWEDVVCLPETTLTRDPDTNVFLIQEFSATPVVDGIYTVTINKDAVFECTGKAAMVDGVACTILGDTGFVGGESTGEPFATIIWPRELVETMGSVALMDITDTSSSATLSIVGKQPVIKKLDPKFVEIKGETVFLGIELNYAMTSVQTAYPFSVLEGLINEGKNIVLKVTFPNSDMFFHLPMVGGTSDTITFASEDSSTPFGISFFANKSPLVTNFNERINLRSQNGTIFFLRVKDDGTLYTSDS